MHLLIPLRNTPVLFIDATTSGFSKLFNLNAVSCESKDQTMVALLTATDGNKTSIKFMLSNPMTGKFDYLDLDVAERLSSDETAKVVRGQVESSAETKIGAIESR